jgi:hypothetical protein
VQRFASGSFEFSQRSIDNSPERRVRFGERCEPVERPCFDEGLVMLDVFAQNCFHSSPIFRRPVEQRQGPDDLEPHLPPIAVGERANEESFVGLDPLGMIVGKLFEQIQGSLRNEGIFVTCQGSKFVDESRVVINQFTCAIRLRYGPTIPATQKRTQFAVCTQPLSAASTSS